MAAPKWPAPKKLAPKKPRAKIPAPKWPRQNGRAKVTPTRFKRHRIWLPIAAPFSSSSIFCVIIVKVLSIISCRRIRNGWSSNKTTTIATAAAQHQHQQQVQQQQPSTTRTEWHLGNRVARLCLHAAKQKASLMSLLQLKHNELELNARNKAGFTLLHQFVMHEDLGMVMCLLSYGAGFDEQTDSGKITALHFAVSKRNLQSTRLLFCLCADPNVANAHGDTPRYLAAKLNE
ncbi:hypothetical protein niasHT_008582 [Heterodera trifolii]|uniref:ANK_REP_REGION domain-containing protein n=1 Tax=Heterodera trifolii TaxID=157864 RepID=A0ABD2M390_9BILA